MLKRYIRPILDDRVLAGIRPLDLQTMYQEMTKRSLSARTVRYAHVVVKSAMQQAVRWRLLLENPADGLRVPQQVRNEMRSLTIEQERMLLKAAERTKYPAHGPSPRRQLRSHHPHGRRNPAWVVGSRQAATILPVIRVVRLLRPNRCSWLLARPTKGKST